jgi:hypothetical protein
LKSPEKLRDEQKFASPAELREQIARDIAQVRTHRFDFWIFPAFSAEDSLVFS